MKCFKFNPTLGKLLFPIIMLFISLSLPAQDIIGVWSGKLKVINTELTIVFNIDETELGYLGTMDSPDQGAYGIPCDEVIFDNNKLNISIKSMGVSYSGTLNGDKTEGLFTQSGMNLPLDLNRTADKPSPPSRPQEPQQPYPYYTEDLTFENKKEGITLAGTLTLPSDKGKHPVVVLISGSGAQDRNQEILGHKPFLVIADYLTRNGIGVLRFDDRGTAQSGGDFESATSENFANDAEAAFKYLLSRKDIDKKKIGLIGHSEGGVIAPMVAERNKKVSFIVLLAGTGVRGDDLLIMQTRTISKAMGVPDEAIEQVTKINYDLYNIILNSKEGDNWKALISDYFDNFAEENNLTDEAMKAQVEQQKNSALAQFEKPWVRYFIKHDPATVLRKLKTPVLALNGSLDLQVPAKENLSAIETALKQAKNKKYKIVELEGLNHLFQETTTGLPTEYEQIEQTFSPRALEEMLKWIKEVI